MICAISLHIVGCTAPTSFSGKCDSLFDKSLTNIFQSFSPLIFLAQCWQHADHKNAKNAINNNIFHILTCLFENVWLRRNTTFASYLICVMRQNPFWGQLLNRLRGLSLPTNDTFAARAWAQLDRLNGRAFEARLLSFFVDFWAARTCPWDPQIAQPLTSSISVEGCAKAKENWRKTIPNICSIYVFFFCQMWQRPQLFFWIYWKRGRSLTGSYLEFPTVPTKFCENRGEKTNRPISAKMKGRKKKRRFHQMLVNYSVTNLHNCILLFAFIFSYNQYNIYSSFEEVQKYANQVDIEQRCRTSIFFQIRLQYSQEQGQTR